MHYSHRLSLVGHLDLKGHLRPLSLAGQFRIETNAANITEMRRRFQVVAMMVGALLVLPGALALVIGLSRYPLGLPYLYDAAFSSTAFITLATASLFMGTPLALLLNILAVIRLSLIRQPSGLTTSLTLEATILNLTVLGIAVMVVGVWFGHLAADGLACFYGVKSDC